MGTKHLIAYPVLVVLSIIGFSGWFVEHTKKPAPAPQAQTQPKVEASEGKCKDRNYTVVAGDSLWKIASKQYGNRGYLYPLIVEKNKIKNPNLIQIGDELTIPCSICDLEPIKPEAMMPRLTMVKKVVKERVSKPTPAPAPVCPAAAPCPAPVPAPAGLQVQVTPPQPAPAVQIRVEQNVNVQTAQPAVPTPAPAPPPPPARQPEPEAKVMPPPPVLILPPPLVAPGSLWNTALTTPVERGNWANYFHVDQGVVIGRIGKINLMPYIAVNAVKDTKGYSWNNRVEAEAGLRLVRSFDHGMIMVGGAYAVERRAGVKGSSSTQKSAPIGYYSQWFGWDQPTSRSSEKKFFSGLPGSTWFTIGNISPYERNNVIGLGRIEQGFTLVKIGRVSFIPQGTLQAGGDTDKNRWNNRVVYGGGLKIVIPTKTSSFDVSGGYECAKQYRGAGIGSVGGLGSRACGPTVRVNIWTGWRLK